MDIQNLEPIHHYTVSNQDPDIPDPRNGRIPIVNPKYSQSLISWLFNSYGTCSNKRFELMGVDANQPNTLLVNYQDDPVVNTKRARIIATVLKVFLLITIIVPVIALVVHFINVNNAQKYQFVINPDLSQPSPKQPPPDTSEASQTSEMPLPPPAPPPFPKEPPVQPIADQAPQPTSQPVVEASKPSAVTPPVNTDVFMPKILHEFILINKVIAQDNETKEKKEIEVTPVHIGKNLWGFDVFYLIPKEIADAVKSVEIPPEEADVIREELTRLSLGKIQIEKTSDAIYIREMNAYKTTLSKSYKHIGNALHEFAIRYSFSQQFEGRVVLESARGTDGFHYKFGYRYQEHLWMSDIRCIKKIEHSEETEQLCSWCEEYLLKKKAGSGDADLEDKIAKHSGYVDIENTAANELKRKPVDLLESINYGLWIYWDVHKVYDKFYVHPEENIASRVCNPKEGKFKNDHKMFLPDEQRAKWKQIIES